MTATVADIAAFTNDGVVLTSTSEQVHLTHPDADKVELENHFDDADDAQVMLDERFAIRSLAGRMHESVEIGDRLGLGTSVTVAPKVPRFRVTDGYRDIDGIAAVRAYSFLFETDRYAVELVGMPTEGGVSVTVDSTIITVDDTSHTSDET